MLKWLGCKKISKEKEGSMEALIDTPRPTSSPRTLVVDTDLTPFVPHPFNLRGNSTWHYGIGKVTLTNREQKLYVNGAELLCYRSPNQENFLVINGHKLRRELSAMLVLNACFLDALLENQEFIPEGWRDLKIYFWATVFQDSSGRLCVAYLQWHDGQWDRGFRQLDTEWSSSERAAYIEDLPAAV
jgi:hypothetical protein